jgi:acyl-CoA reductase-like NAD-dependent aldehyde dehydrogenase
VISDSDQAWWTLIDPSTGRDFATVRCSGEADMNVALARARAVQARWSATTTAHRGAIIGRLAESLEANAERLARTVSREQGKPLRSALSEVRMASAICRYFAGLAGSGDVLAGRRAYGVVAAITPWNFPVKIPIMKIAAAALAGNAVVLKPAVSTSLSGSMLISIAAELFPEGLVTSLIGGDDVGSRLCDRDEIGLMSFTGSIENGRRIGAAAARRLVPVILELGGNDPAVILDSADLQRVLPDIVSAAFANNGQSCTALKRLYVHSRRYDELVSRLVEAVSEIRIGPALEPKVQVGPLAHEGQLLRMRAYVEDAKAAGATIFAGRQSLPSSGYFFPPTVVTGVSNGMRIVDEEQFGPVLPVMRFDEVDEAVGAANDSHFGLGASVWSEDESEALAVGSRLDAATVWVNCHGFVYPDHPFGGWKQSGLAAELGPRGLEPYSRQQIILGPEGSARPPR